MNVVNGILCDQYGNPCNRDVCKRHGHPWSNKQAEAYQDYADVRAEQDFERRTAFGSGVDVVDVLTGERYRT